MANESNPLATMTPEELVMVEWLGELRTAQTLIACGNIDAANGYLEKRIKRLVDLLLRKAPE